MDVILRATNDNTLVYTAEQDPASRRMIPGITVNRWIMRDRDGVEQVIGEIRGNNSVDFKNTVWLSGCYFFVYAGTDLPGLQHSENVWCLDPKNMTLKAIDAFPLKGRGSKKSVRLRGMRVAGMDGKLLVHCRRGEGEAYEAGSIINDFIILDPQSCEILAECSFPQNEDLFGSVQVSDFSVLGDRLLTVLCTDARGKNSLMYLDHELKFVGYQILSALDKD